MANGFVSDVDDEILTEVIALAKKSKTAPIGADGELEPPFASYVEQLVRYATGEDIIWSEPKSLLLRAESAWKNSASRKPGQNCISLRVEEKGLGSGVARLVLDIATDDKPFLVDSISAALSDAGKPVSFFSNAVVDVARDAKGKRNYQASEATRESLIHAEMDPPVSETELNSLEDELARVLDQVAIAVADWESMRARLGACIAQLEKSRLPGVKGDEQREAISFLKWLWDNRFAFLGVRYFTYENKNGDIYFDHKTDRDLGILRDPEQRILNSTFTASGELSPAVAAFLESSEPIIIAKSNSRSSIHRRVYMDYIGVKTFSVDGRITGEERFIGLFTADAYNRPATDIPLIRSKVEAVIERTAFAPGGHNEKAMSNILETYPRDELFQISVDELQEIALGILRLYKRPRVKLFLRRDRFDRFVSAIVFVPRDYFNSEVREAIGALIAKAYDGRVVSFSPHFGDAALVRVHFIIGINQGAPEGPGLTELTRDIRLVCRTWRDDLLDAMREANGGVAPAPLFDRYSDAFSAGYRERFSAEEALNDINAVERLRVQPLQLRAYRSPGDDKTKINLRIYVNGVPIPLSRLIPTLENLGLSVIQEAGYKISPAGAVESCWIHDFQAEQSKQKDVELEDVKSAFEDTIAAALNGLTEDDGFNALVLTAGISWREAWMLRAAARHHMQAGFAYSLAYIEEALGNHPAIVRELITLFHARFNPEGPSNSDQRIADVEAAEQRIFESLNAVESLDEDRIIRRFVGFFAAVMRTNYYQLADDGGCKPYISFKIDSSKIEDIPEPVPYREIFVSGPRVDGVHLRFGPVARGGLRWSDRREDFRTEVLGLVKAQRVKNAVIVPTGSKGGFYPKQLPQTSDRGAIYEEGREAYKLFIRGLLDLTDNIVHGKIKSPSHIVRWDDTDPYLVVAADKGTAQFSDTANAISEEYGFWLGDAFASGGSAGYDHKVMGITARGAWEAVKRHFREMGKDIQSEPFTVAGVGDMSGDVFGNGMLLSEQIRLVAAFDHRDIFIDPNPDPATSFTERKRMFALPRSSWQDYDKSLISAGGGVFSRSAKSIPLSPEMKQALGVVADKLSPNELIRTILKAPVELFWLGGIGTYFKSEDEENWRVGDRANDAVRINAGEIGAKVIGEGANLGLTQLARIEFAQAGGRINTDAIDNSAGVDSSDHEVNIKILLSAAIEKGELKVDARNPLLASMTNDVALHVLRHNYDQTRAISQMEATATRDIDAYGRFMSTLERLGRLDRDIEYLPDAETIALRKQRGEGLTRPELSVLIAYAKMWLFDELVASSTPDDPMLERELFAYFPRALQEYNSAIVSHRLRREIIATRLANEIIDSCGVLFAQRSAESVSANFATIGLAYEAARRIFQLGDFATAVDALDNKTASSIQIELLLEASTLLREQVFHMLSHAPSRDALTKGGLKAVIGRYQSSVAEFKTAMESILPADEIHALSERRDEWVQSGAPANIANDAALIPTLEHALDIVDLAAETGWSNPAVGGVFFAVGKLLKIDAMRQRSRRAPPSDHFDKVAARQLIEDLAVRQHAISRCVIAFANNEPKGDVSEWIPKLMSRWEEANDDALSDFESSASDLDLAAQISVGKLTLFTRKLDELAEKTGRC